MTNENTFVVDKPEESLGLLLWQTTITWQRQIRDLLEPYGISHPQFVIMAILLWHDEHQDIINQVTIINMSKLDKMTVSASLKKLTTLGYVHREENSIDTRSKSVSLTQLGTEFIRQLVPQIEQLDATFFGRLNQEDQKEITRILGQLTVEERK